MRNITASSFGDLRFFTKCACKKVEFYKILRDSYIKFVKASAIYIKHDTIVRSVFFEGSRSRE